MPNLHAHYYLGNVKQFRQELDTSTSSSSKGGGGGGGQGQVGSAGKSWGNGGFEMRSGGKADPNERDSLGRTVLHLAASSTTPQGYTFLTTLLKNPNILVNLQDHESGQTALHRALYVGNIKAARDLLLRNDIDLSIKDIEGLTAFDLYNGTVEGTNPPHDVNGSDLYVWGVNRNFALGTGDSNDKAFADRVNLLTQSQASGKPDPMQRFFHIGVRDVQMAKLHTAVVTDESRGNLSLCGFGSNGRLGRNIHSQLSLTPMSDFPHSVVSTALGQDHTLALTSGGYILSWGHNRFSQLGYAIEQPESTLGRGKDELEVQVSPKRVAGMLKKEVVKGVAAGRMASACWTDDALYTWGTNAGHLGYDKVSNPVQVLPRKVPAISQPIIDVALSDYAMICLVDTQEVICFHHDANFKITFPIPRSSGFGYRPPHLANRPMIKKITSSAVTFAALSSLGDVFTFQLPNPLEDISKDVKERHVNVKPQLIWGLRKKFTAAQDVGIGSDGTTIVCTTSGHVYVRQRVKSGAGQLKFRRIPYLQRIIKVACNESGAFAAIRIDARAPHISLKGPTLEDDLFLLQPHFRRFDHQMTAEDFDKEKTKIRIEEEEDDESANSVTNDIAIATRMCTVLGRWRRDDNDSLFSWSEPLMGSDSWLVAGEIEVPAHSIILGLRVPALRRLLDGDKIRGLTLNRDNTGIKIITQARHPLVVLLLLQYIYTDEVAAIWDARVARTIQDKFKDMELPIGDIKLDLKSIADTLSLQPLSTVLNSASKASMPKHTLSDDLLTFFASTHAAEQPPSACDTTLVLANREVQCSSVLLRSRCPFFEAMFEDRDWTAPRVEDGGRVVIHMEHLKWRPMNLVFKYLHGGREDDLFDYHHQETLDEFLDFVFEVLAAATELLLDRLVLVCSKVVIRHCNAYNAAALACEAAFYQAHTLKLSIFDFIVASMETMLESGLLDEMDEDVLQELCMVIAKKQEVRLGVSRDGTLLNELVGKWGDWLALQDVPAPRVRPPFRPRIMRSPKLSPLEPMTTQTNRDKGKRRPQPPPSPSPVASPDLRSQHTGADDIFAMDDDAMSPPTATGRHTPRSTRPMTPLDLHSGSGSLRPGQVPWKSRTVESGRVDLRSIMAETQASKTPPRPVTASTPTSIMSANRPSPVLTASASSFSPARATNIKSPPTSSGGPWRQVEQTRPSLSSVQASQSTAPLPSASTPGSARRAPPQSSPIPQRGMSSGSKIFTPTKVPSASTLPRKASSGSAWASATSFAPPAPIAVSPTTQSLSLLQIQQQEQDYLERAKQPVAMRSFAEIIEQEEKDRQEEARKTAEVEYDLWLQGEIAKNEGSGSGSSGRGRGRGRGGGGGAGQRKVPTRGKARGGGDAGLPKTPATARIDDEPTQQQRGSPAKSRGGRGGRGRGGGGGQPGPSHRQTNGNGHPHPPPGPSATTSHSTQAS